MRIDWLRRGAGIVCPVLETLSWGSILWPLDSPQPLERRLLEGKEDGAYQAEEGGEVIPT